jgi:hypothetical protein
LKHKLRRSLVTANYPHSESDVKPVLTSLAITTTSTMPNPRPRSQPGCAISLLFLPIHMSFPYPPCSQGKRKEKASMFNALQRAEHGVEEKEKVDLVHGGTTRFATKHFKKERTVLDECTMLPLVGSFGQAMSLREE